MVVTIIIGEIIFYLEEKSNTDSQEVELQGIEIREPIMDLLGRLFQSTSQNQEILYQEFSMLHDNKDSYSKNFNLVADYLLITEKSHIAKAYFDLESQYHLENKLNLYKCVKYHLGTNHKSLNFFSLAKIPESCVDKFKSKIFSYELVKMLLKFLKNPCVMTTINYLMTVKQITWYFIDFIKDIFLIITITRFVPLSASSWDSFGCQIFIVLLFSIILPELANFFTFWKNSYSSLCNIWTSVKVFLLAFTPILSSVALYVSSIYKTRRNLIYLKENIGLQKGNLDIFHRNFLTVRERVKRLHENENRWHEISARMRRNENIFEHTLQAIILVIFTTLIFTKTQTVDGLQQLYANENTGWFILSAILSLRSLIVGYQGWIDSQKNNTLSLAGKIILQLFAFLSLVVRLSAIILFFAPSLGLLNLLMHWKMGSIPGIYNFLQQFNNLPDPRKNIFYLIFQFGDNLIGEIPDVDTMERMLKDFGKFDNGWIEVEYYHNLTMFTIETYYKCFLVGVIMHFSLVWCINYFFGEEFSTNTSLPFEEKFLNVTAQFLIPSLFKDWDTENVSFENVNKYKEKWKKVSIEMKALLFLFTIENILLLIPLFILKHTITIRNEYLNEKFPQIQEELFSTNLVFYLAITMPVVYIVIPFIQYFLFIVYNKYGHPWSQIFNYEKLNEIY
jgi:hypothetical protein